jgi:hypothetical protein
MQLTKQVYWVVLPTILCERTAVSWNAHGYESGFRTYSPPCRSTFERLIITPGAAVKQASCSTDMEASYLHSLKHALGGRLENVSDAYGSSDESGKFRTSARAMLQEGLGNKLNVDSLRRRFSSKLTIRVYMLSALASYWVECYINSRLGMAGFLALESRTEQTASLFAPI